nr:MAG TPA_asm: hypothetical protein [Caudoviricetes sp.]
MFNPYRVYLLFIRSGGYPLSSSPGDGLCNGEPL